MSIESFFGQNQPGAEFRAYIYTRSKQESHPISPIGMLAKLYREEGSQQIKDITQILAISEGSILTVPTLEFVLSRLNPEQISSWRLNAIAIIFGCAIPTIESTAKEGWLDMNVFSGLYNFAKAGTYLSEIPTPNIQEVLTATQWGALDQAIRSNPLYDLFLEEKGISLLPPTMATTLRNAYTAFQPAALEFKTKHNLLAQSLIA